MLDGVIRWRTIWFGVSCLVHVGLAGAVLVAERVVPIALAWRSPTLDVVLVAPDEARPPQPVTAPPVPRKPPPPRPKPLQPPKPLQLPRPIETPLPQVTGAPAAPPPEPLVAPQPEPKAAAPAALAVAAPEPPATVGGHAAGDRPAGPPISVLEGGPVASTGPLASSGAAGAGVAGRGRTSGPAAVAAVPGDGAGSTGAISRYARPRGGYQLRPSYPSSARRQGVQGTTLLRVHVLDDGRVGEIIVQESAGHPDLDQAAAGAVRQWRFEPARRGDEPVAMWVLLPIEFRLR